MLLDHYFKNQCLFYLQINYFFAYMITVARINFAASIKIWKIYVLLKNFDMLSEKLYIICRFELHYSFSYTEHDLIITMLFEFGLWMLNKKSVQIDEKSFAI